MAHFVILSHSSLSRAFQAIFCLAIYCLFFGCHCSFHRKSLADCEKQLWIECNRFRKNQSLPEYTLNASLCRLAKAYSRDMATRNFFSHMDPDGRNVKERLWCSGIPFKNAGENLARISSCFVASEIIEGWKKSAPHRENLTSQAFTQIGLGIFQSTDGQYYVTVILVSPSQSME